MVNGLKPVGLALGIGAVSHPLGTAAFSLATGR